MSVRTIPAAAALAILLAAAAGGCRRGGAELPEGAAAERREAGAPEAGAPAAAAPGDEVGALRQALELGTSSAYSEFLKRFPASAQAEAVRALLERRLYDAALASEEPAGLVTFLERFPRSPLAVAAEQELERRDFDRATETGTREAFEQFLVAHPKGRYAQQIRSRVEAIHAKTLTAVLDIKAVRYKNVSYEDVLRAFESRLGPKLAELNLEWALLRPSDLPKLKEPSRYRLDIEYEESQGLPYSHGFGTNVSAAFRLIEQGGGGLLWEHKIFASTDYEVKIDPDAVYESLRRDAVDAFWRRFEIEFQPSEWKLPLAPGPALAASFDPYRMRVRGGLAYLGGEDGVTVVDLGDPAKPKVVGEVGGTGRIHDLALPEGRWGYATAASGDGRLRLLVLDLAEPRAPKLAGAFPLQDVPRELFEVGAAAALEQPGALVGLEPGAKGPVAKVLGGLRLPGEMRGLAIVGDRAVVLTDQGLYAIELRTLGAAR